MTPLEIADEFIGLIPTPNGSWDEIKQELADKIEAYALSKQQVKTVGLADVVKSCLTTEIVERRISGKEVVKYRAPYGSDEALQMIDDIDGCPSYFYRHV